MVQGNNDSELSISQSTFHSNSARGSSAIGGSASGGALFALSLTRGIVAGTFLRNSASEGGAIAAKNGTNLVISDSTFKENTAEQGGALIVNVRLTKHKRNKPCFLS